MIGAFRSDLAAGFGLLTRLPVGWLSPDAAPFNPQRAVWSYPVAGLAVGGSAAATLLAAHRVGLPPLVAAGWSLCVSMLITGGLHEDGLADTADGFGGGRTRDRRLEIMRDSRIGSFGTSALGLALVLRLAALDAMPAGRAAFALLAAGCLSRAAMLPALTLLPPARPDGLGRSVSRPPVTAISTGMAIAVVAAAVMLPNLRTTVMALIVAAAVALAMARMARRRIGGYTGDTLGATSVAVECAVLSVLAAG